MAERSPLREAATIALLGWLAGCLLFSFATTMFTLDAVPEQQGLLGVGMALIGFAAISGMLTGVAMLPVFVALIVLLRRAGVGRVPAALACIALGVVGAFVFFLLLAQGGLIGIMIPAPAAQGVATALIYLRFSDG